MKKHVVEWGKSLACLFMVLLLIPAGVAIAAKPAPPSTGAVLAGKVTDATTAVAISGAAITAVGTPGTFSALTDRKGQYSITLPEGTYQITAAAQGFVDQSVPRTLSNGVTTTVNFALQPGSNNALPHADKISGYSGPESCLLCHRSAIADEVFNSAHFQARTPTQGIDMPAGGSHGMVDRACGLPGTTMMAGNFATQAISPLNGSLKDDGCGKCHIASLPPYYYSNAAQALPDLDCLRCHAQIYGEEWEHQEIIDLYGENSEPHIRQIVVNDQGMKIFTQDRSLKTAQSVGGKVSAEACLRCHEHNFSGYKRSTPFTPATDLHAAKGFRCTTCHTVSQHRIARGTMVTDGVANDLPNVEVSCQMSGCHGSTPHNLNYAADLNRHITNVSCEVCHIHSMNEPNNIYRRSWAPSTLDPISGQWQSTPANTNNEYPGFWDAYTEYLPIGTRTTTRWFNGVASMLAQPYGGFQERVSTGGESKLFSFKPFVSGMLFDAAWLPGPPRDGSFDLVNNTWPASMKSFYEQNWPKFVAFGFIDASYPNPGDYWESRPDMAIMLNNFPMMLYFDRGIYLSESGTVIGNPGVGPQSAATYPGVARAINAGMGRMAIDMGYFPADSDPEMAGAFMWSGQFFGMWVPPNMDMNSLFFGEVVSFITLSHAVKSNSAYDGTACYACHFTEAEYLGSGSNNKYLSFALLGYPDRDANGRVDPMYDRDLTPEICNDGIDNDGDGFIDCADANCLGTPECSLQSESICDDSIDNDSDGLIDCADPDCAGIGLCGPEGLASTCSDGIDNDGDGLIDCADPGCAKNRACR